MNCKGEFQVAVCLVAPQLYAKAEMQQLKTLPLSDRSEDALTVLRSFEFASKVKIRCKI